MIVIDASVIAFFFLREEGWEGLTEYMKNTVSLDLAVKEFYNAVWRAIYLQKRLSVDDAGKVLSLFKKYLSKNMVLLNELKYIDKGFEITLAKGVTVYDALYIALALEEGKPLATLDTKQRLVAQEYGITVFPP